MQRGEVPLTVPAFTLGFTVSTWDALTGLPQPLLMVYVIFVVPALTAVTTPVDELTVATPVLELLQEPPPDPLLVYVAVAAIHNGEVPLTAPALTFGLTVRFLEADTGLPPQGSV